MALFAEKSNNATQNHLGIAIGKTVVKVTGPKIPEGINGASFQGTLNLGMPFITVASTCVLVKLAPVTASPVNLFDHVLATSIFKVFIPGFSASVTSNR